MAHKSVSLMDKLSTPIGVKWNLKENDEGFLEWQAESKGGLVILDSKDKKKKAKADNRYNAGGKSNRAISNTGANYRQRPPVTANKGLHGNRHGSPHRLKKAMSKNALVTIADIKAVAYDQLCEVDHIPPDFDKRIFEDPQFDNFLYNLLYYFDCFFKKEELEQKGLTSTSIEPGQLERKGFADSCAKVEVARKKLGRAYCHLILGVDSLRDAHHMHCGTKRVSDTYRDRYLYESLYQYCCFVVWITFRRKDFDVIKKQMGTTLRSDTFNPAIRVKNAPDNDEDEKTDVNNPKKKISPAEYRRIHPKRPAIRSIINQRSPAVVSILPSSKEEALHLFKHQRPPSPSSILASAASTLNDDKKLNDIVGEVDQVDAEIQAGTIRIGILHDSMENYNPVNLQGKGQDVEQNADEDAEGNKDETMLNVSGAVGQDNSHNQADAPPTRASTALSYTTTVAPSEI